MDNNFFFLLLPFCFRMFIHNKMKSFSNLSQIWNYRLYTDGTVINCRDFNTIITESAINILPYLSLHIIHSNGIVTELNKKLNIQEFNWLI